MATRGSDGSRAREVEDQRKAKEVSDEGPTEAEVARLLEGVPIDHVEKEIWTDCNDFCEAKDVIREGDEIEFRWKGDKFSQLGSFSGTAMGNSILLKSGLLIEVGKCRAEVTGLQKNLDRKINNAKEQALIHLCRQGAEFCEEKNDPSTIHVDLVRFRKRGARALPHQDKKKAQLGSDLKHRVAALRAEVVNKDEVKKGDAVTASSNQKLTSVVRKVTVAATSLRTQMQAFKDKVQAEKGPEGVGEVMAKRKRGLAGNAAAVGAQVHDGLEISSTSAEGEDEAKGRRHRKEQASSSTKARVQRTQEPRKDEEVSERGRSPRRGAEAERMRGSGEEPAGDDVGDETEVPTPERRRKRRRRRVEIGSRKRRLLRRPRRRGSSDKEGAMEEESPPHSVSDCTRRSGHGAEDRKGNSDAESPPESRNSTDSSLGKGQVRAGAAEETRNAKAKRRDSQSGGKGDGKTYDSSSVFDKDGSYSGEVVYDDVSRKRAPVDHDTGNEDMPVHSNEEGEDVVKVGTVTLKGVSTKDIGGEGDEPKSRTKDAKEPRRHFDPRLAEGDSSGDVGIKLWRWLQHDSGVLGKLSILSDNTRNSGVSEDILPLPLSWDCILASFERTSCEKLQQMQHQGCKQGKGRLSLGCAVCGVHAWTALQIVACNGMHTAFNLANVQEMMKGHTAKVSDLQLEAIGLLCEQAGKFVRIHVNKFKDEDYMPMLRDKALSEDWEAWWTHIDDQDEVEVKKLSKSDELANSVSPWWQVLQTCIVSAASVRNVDRSSQSSHSKNPWDAWASGLEGCVTPGGQRLMKLVGMTVAALNCETINKHAMKVLTGYWMFILPLRRELMAILDESWTQTIRMQGECKLTLEVKTEFMALLCSLPFVQLDLHRTLDEQVTCSDAVEDGGRVSSTRTLNEKGLSALARIGALNDGSTSDCVGLLEIGSGLACFRRTLGNLGLLPALYGLIAPDQTKKNICRENWEVDFTWENFGDISPEGLLSFLLDGPNVTFLLLTSECESDVSTRAAIDHLIGLFQSLDPTLKVAVLSPISSVFRDSGQAGIQDRQVEWLTSWKGPVLGRVGGPLSTSIEEAEVEAGYTPGYTAGMPLRSERSQSSGKARLELLQDFLGPSEVQDLVSECLLEHGIGPFQDPRKKKTLDDVLQDHQWPVNADSSKFGTTLGLTSRNFKDSQPDFNSYSRENPELIQRLNLLIRQESHPGFFWTSISVKVDENKAEQMHSTNYSMGPSLVITGGRYTGGKFSMEIAGHKVSVDTQNVAWMFDSGMKHAHEEYIGKMVSLVAFCSPAIRYINGKMKLWLEEQGFKLPPSNESISQVYPLHRPFMSACGTENYNQTLVYESLRRYSHRGKELQALALENSLAEWPLHAVDHTWWNLHKAVAYHAGGDEVAQVELQAALAALVWQTRKPDCLRKIGLHLMDNQAVPADVADQRSQSKPLNELLRQIGGLKLASGRATVYAYYKSLKTLEEGPIRKVVRERPPRRRPTDKQIIIVGLAGPSGVGKSTLAGKFAGRLKSPLEPISLDRYFRSNLKPAEPGGHVNYETPEAIDFELLRNDLNKVSQELAAAKVVPDALMVGPRQKYNVVHGKQIGKDLETGTIYVIVEGFLLYCDARLCHCFDIQLWLEADLDICLERRRQRGRKKDKEKFSKMYRNHIWHHFQLFRESQITNSEISLYLDGAEPVDQLVDKAAQACLEFEPVDEVVKKAAADEEKEETPDEPQRPKVVIKKRVRKVYRKAGAKK